MYRWWQPIRQTTWHRDQFSLSLSFAFAFTPTFLFSLDIHQRIGDAASPGMTFPAFAHTHIRAISLFFFLVSLSFVYLPLLLLWSSLMEGSETAKWRLVTFQTGLSKKKKIVQVLPWNRYVNNIDANPQTSTLYYYFLLFCQAQFKIFLIIIFIIIL